MHELAGARTRAYLIDCGVYLAIAATTAPLVVLSAAKGWEKNRSFVLAVSAIPPVVATVVAARQESGPESSTFGKRRHGLVVRTRDGEPVTFTRALIRNVAKIAIPWQLGHFVAISAALGYLEDGDRLTVGATALIYPVLGAMVVAGASGSGRAFHDRLADTVVELVAQPS